MKAIEPLEITLTENLFNRTQWYTLRIKFSTVNAELSGTYVNISPSVSFVDSRKRHTSLINQGLSIDLEGVCSSTGISLTKCEKCRNNDRKIIARKRNSDSWNEKDELNNNKLFQVAHVTNDMINADGILKLKIRVMCCIGSFRQFHFNHCNNDMKLPLIKHKECNGINLRFNFHLNGNFLKAMLHESNIRVIGKVTAKTREIIQNQFNIEDEDTGLTIMSMNLAKRELPADDTKSTQPFKKFCREIKSIKKPPKELEPDYIATDFSEKGQPYKKYCIEIKSHCTMRKHNELTDMTILTKNSYHILPKIFRGSEFFINQLEPLIPPDKIDDQFLVDEEMMPHNFYRLDLDEFPSNWTILELLNILKTPVGEYDILKYCINHYKNTVDIKYPIQFRQIFDDRFFSTITDLKEDSVVPLYLINMIYVVYLYKQWNCVDSRTMYQLSLLSEKIYNNLLSVIDVIHVPSIEDYSYIAESITRAAIFQVMHRKNFRSATEIFKKAYTIFQQVASRDPCILQSTSYELLVMHRVYLNLDENILQEALPWAMSYDSCRVRGYIIFLKIIIQIYPEFYSFCKNNWMIDLELQLPREEQRFSLLRLCEMFPFSQSGSILNRAVDLLRYWIISDLDSIMTCIDNLKNLMVGDYKNYLSEPLPIQMILWVSIQLYSRIRRDNIYVDRISSLKTNIQLISHIFSNKIVRAWCFPIYMFNYRIFTKYSS